MLPELLTLRWQADVKRLPVGAPALGRQVLAVTSYDRYVRLIASETGEVLWRSRLNAVGATGPLIASDRVLSASAGRDGRVYALRLRDGHEIWHFDIGSVSNPIATNGDVLIAASERGMVVSLAIDEGTDLWRRALGGPVRSGVTLLGDQVFVATDDSLFLLDRADGSIEAAAAAPGSLVAPPARSGDTLIVTSPDGLVAGLAREDLGTLWVVEVGGAVFGAPAVARDTVFAVTVNGTLWAIPLADPARSSSRELEAVVRATPVPLADGILVATVSGEVLFAGSEGEPPALRVRVDGPIEAPPIVVDGMLIVIDGRGKIQAWR